MSWLFGPKSNLPPITPLQDQRTKQIESLKLINHNVVELKKDVEYRVTFSIGNGASNIALHLTLPPQFPQEKPHVKVSPPMRHPWVSNTLTVVGCPGLNNFGVHTDLGRVIQSIIQEMKQKPPFVFTADPVQANAGTMYQPYTPPLSMGSPSQLPLSNQQPMFRPGQGIVLQGNQPPATASLMGTQTTQLPGLSSSVHEVGPVNQNTLEYLGIQPSVTPTGLDSNGPTSHKYAMPPIPASFHEHLSSLSIGQLQELLADEEKELEIFSELPQIRRLLTERQALYDVCEHLAQTNISYQPEIDKLKARLSERAQEKMNLRNSFDMSCLKQQGISEQYNPQHLLDILKVSAADIEHESESRADSFLEGKTTTEEFLKEYSELRKTMHLRRVKEEKLDYLLRQGARLK